MILTIGDKNEEIINISLMERMDIVLKELSKLIQTNIRKCDVLARIGGEEFVIIATETSAANAFVLSENLRKIVEKHNFKIVRNIRISLGITQFVEEDNADSIFKRADVALYSAKNEGRNRSKIEIFEHNLNS